MTKQTITKILFKFASQPLEYSLGFRRYSVLPVRIKQNINLACILRGENSHHDSFLPLFNLLTEQEFLNWLEIN